jgi:hypothetical protein
MLARLDSMKEHRRDDGMTVDPPYVDASHRASIPSTSSCAALHASRLRAAAARSEGQATVGSWWTGGFICPCHQSGFD